MKLINESDLKLSSKFEKQLSQIEIEKTNLLEVYKNERSDTTEALLLLRTNSAFFTEKFKSFSVLNRKSEIIKYLLNAFPEANINIIKKELMKLGYFDYDTLTKYNNYFCIVFFIISTIIAFMMKSSFLIIIPLITSSIAIGLVIDYFLNKLR